MAIKFNVDPYYDDFLKAGTDTLTPQEKYHKVLFRPGIAVQAREMTQLQSILQNQVTQFGNHMFKEGSLVIPGGNAYNNYADYVKLSAVNQTVGDTLIGKMVANADGLRAKIIKAVAATGSDPDTFYVVYQNSTVHQTLTKYLVPLILLLKKYGMLVPLAMTLVHLLQQQRQALLQVKVHLFKSKKVFTLFVATLL